MINKAILDYKFRESKLRAAGTSIPDFWLYVEGKLDLHFMESLDERKYGCVIAINGRNRKENVKKVVSLGDPKVYGLVDKDFEEPFGIERLFYTDTHDLETLLLLNDDELLSNVCKQAGLTITQDVLEKDVKKVKYLAYQIGVIKKAVHNIVNEGFNMFIPNNVPLDYQKFTTTDYKVVLENFCQFVESNGGNIKKKDLLIDEKINLFFTDYSNLGKVFNQNINTICDISQTSDFWNIVNGHDICELLCFTNDDVNKAFYKRNPTDNFRIKIFEDNLIEAFRKRYFKSTILYFNMATAKLF